MPKDTSQQLIEVLLHARGTARDLRHGQVDSSHVLHALCVCDQECQDLMAEAHMTADRIMLPLRGLFESFPKSPLELDPSKNLRAAFLAADMIGDISGDAEILPLHMYVAILRRPGPHLMITGMFAPWEELYAAANAAMARYAGRRVRNDVVIE